MSAIKELLAAAKTGNITQIKEILNSGIKIDAYLETVDPESKCPPHTTALMIAAKFAQRDAVTFLLNQGANAGMKNSSGHNAFHLTLLSEEAVNRESLDKIAILLMDNPRTNTAFLNKDNRDLSLIYACNNGLSEAVARLLEKNVSLDTVLPDHDERDANALSVAIAKGHANIVQQLINAGANIESILPPSKVSAIEYAKRYSTAEVILLLFNHIVSKNSLEAVVTQELYMDIFIKVATRHVFSYDTFVGIAERLTDLNAYSAEGEPLFFYATETGSEAALKYFINKGADPKKLAKNGANALIPAIRIHSLPIVKLLIESYKLDPNIFYNSRVGNNYGYYSGMTKTNPLCYAVQYSTLEIVQYLVGLSNSINEELIFAGKQTTSALIEACRNRIFDIRTNAIIKTLIDHKASPLQCATMELETNPDNAYDHQYASISPIYVAAINHNFEAVNILCASVLDQSDILRAHLDRTFYAKRNAKTQTNVFTLACTNPSGYDIEGNAAQKIVAIKTMLEIKCTSYSFVSSGLPVIAHAIEQNKASIVSILLKNDNSILNCEFSYDYQMRNGRTDQLTCNPITFAALLERKDMLELFATLEPEQLTKLANMRVDSDGRTVLMYKLFKANCDMEYISAFTKLGAEVNAQDNNGNDILHYAKTYVPDDKRIIKFIEKQLQASTHETSANCRCLPKFKFGL